MPTPGGASSLVHATCIALDGRGALLMGPPGTGKSDLALRCVTSAFRLGERRLEARLVADDQVLIEHAGTTVRALCPQAIEGKLEVRGLGVIQLPYDRDASIHLIVELVPSGDVQRLPEPKTSAQLHGVALPVLQVAPFQASAPVKVLLALSASEP